MASRQGRGEGQGRWIALVCAWGLIAVGLASEPSAVINGAQVGAAVLLAVLFGALRSRRKEGERLGKAEWMVLATVLVTVLTLDWDGIRTEGLVLNASPLVVLVLAALRRRR